MQTRSSDENSVRQSVCLSVKRVDCDKTETKIYTDFYLFIYYVNRTKVHEKIMQKTQKEKKHTKKQKTYKNNKKTPHTVHIKFTIVCTSDIGTQQGSAA